MQETTEKKETFKDYLKKHFSKRQLIEKGIIAGIALALVLIFSLSFYFWLKDVAPGQTIGENGFWYIYIIWNSGIGWSALQNNPTAIYAIQSVMFVLLLAIFLLLSNDRISGSFVALALFGGLFNLIQRAASGTDMVLDYFKFGFWDSFPIFNWPDTFVVIGIFGFIISYITMAIIQIYRERRHEEIEKKQRKIAAEESQEKNNEQHSKE